MRMTDSKMFALALAAALTLAVSACGSTGSSAETSTSETAATETAVAETEVTETSATENEDTSSDGTVVTSTYAEGTAAAELAALYNGGYTVGMTGSNENGIVVNFYNDDHTEFRQATCNMTDEQYEAFFNIDWMAEDYDQQCFDALAACDDLAIITPTLPDMTEYEAYVGKTIGEMEDAGFDFAGYNEDADGNMLLTFYVYTDEGDTYEICVTPDIAEDDDTIYDDDSIRDLTAKEIVFWNFD